MALPSLPALQECAAALDRFAPALLRVAMGSLVVLGLAGLVALTMRRASAAARHEVWLLGSAAVLLLPILSSALPGWHVLPHVAAARYAPRTHETVLEFTDPSVLASAAQATMMRNPQSSAAPPDSPQFKHDKETTMNTSGELPSARPSKAAMTPGTPSQSNLPTSPAPGAEATRSAESMGPRWTGWALLCWPLGTLLVLCRVLLGHLSLWWLRRRCARVTGGVWFDLLQRLRGELGLRRPVELLSSAVGTMPMTWGVWRARVLVPKQATAWPPVHRRDVMLHELGHVWRRDCLAQLLSQLACALYWFNPLAWVAQRRMQVERERACDDLVLNCGAEAPAYARHLLDSVSSVPAALRRAGAAVAMARPSTLEERIRAILNPRLNRRAQTARGSLATVLLLLSVLLPAAVLRAQQELPQDPAVNRGPAGTTGNVRGGRDASPESLQPPTTRPAANPQSGRPVFAGARGGGGGRGIGFGGPGLPTLGEGPTCSFDATIYDVRVPADQIGRLDVDALAKASQSPEEFEKALAALGTAKPMYRANQSVRLSGDTITIGSAVPFVTNSRLTDRGQTMNTVQYQNVGALFSVAGKAGAPGGVDLDLGIEVSSTSETGAAISDTLKAPIMRQATLSHKGPFQPRKPFLVVSVDAGALDKDGKAVAFICRVIMGEPQPPAPR